MRANYLHVVVAAALTALFASTAAAQVGRGLSLHRNRRLHARNARERI